MGDRLYQFYWSWIDDPVGQARIWVARRCGWHRGMVLASGFGRWVPLT